MSVDPLAFFLEKVLPAALSGAGGVLLSIHRIRKTINDRILVLERDTANYEKLLSEYKSDGDKRFSSYKADIENAVAVHQATVRKTLEGLQKELSDNDTEFEQANRASASNIKRNERVFLALEKRVIQAETRLSSLEEVNNKLNDEVRDFIKEQREQWTTMIRVIGQLEGEVKRRTGTSGQFPGTR